MDKEFWCRSHRRYISAVDEAAAVEACHKVGGILLPCEVQEKPVTAAHTITDGVAMPAAGASSQRPGTFEAIPEQAIREAAGAFMIELQDAYIATGIGREVEDGEVVPWIAEASPATALGMHRALTAMLQRSRFLIAKLGFNEKAIKREEAEGVSVGKSINEADMAAKVPERGGRA